MAFETMQTILILYRRKRGFTMQNVENETIVKAIQQGENVQENILLLYNQNMPLIKSTCLKYAGTEQLEDLLQVAFMSLYDSTQKYDAEKGCKYITYCLLWVKQAIIRYLTDCGNIVRLPAEQNQLLFKYKRFVNDFQLVNGRKPTDEEVCQILNITDDNLSLLKIYASGIQSIDEEFETSDSSGTLADTLASDEDIETACVDSMYSEFEKKELWAVVDKVLVESQADVIKERYLNDKTYRQIAEEKGYSFQRARQLEQESLRKLRMKKREFARLDISGSLSYSGSMRKFKEHNFTSCVEAMAIKRIAYEEEYRRIKAEYEKIIAENKRNRICI